MKHTLIEPLISTLNNIQLKMDTATGAATALELRLRIIAQLEPKVQVELRKKTKELYYEAKLGHLIDAVLEVFLTNLDPLENDQIKKCRPPRNKLSHGSFVELMITLDIEPTSREVDPLTKKFTNLSTQDLVEGAKSIERNSGLEKFAQSAREVIGILDRKILRSLKTFP